jgi:hypothetical protein
VELSVDRVGPGGVRVHGAPKLNEPDVVLAAALCARPVSGRERGRFVEEEELGEPAGSHERPAATLELETAGDPAFPVVGAADSSVAVVEATAVAVNETARGVGDQLAERGDAVLSRHLRRALGDHVLVR